MKAVTSVMMVAMKYEQLKETNLSECFQAFYYDNVNHKSTTTAKVSCTISGVLLWSKGKPRDDIVENSLSLQVLLILYLSLSLSVLTQKRALKICQFDKLPILNPLQSVTTINDQPSDYFKKFFFTMNEDTQLATISQSIVTLIITSTKMPFAIHLKYIPWNMMIYKQQLLFINKTQGRDMHTFQLQVMMKD